MTCCDNATAWRGGKGRLFLLLCGILSILTPAFVGAATFNIGDTVSVITDLNVRGTTYPEITDPDYAGYAPAGTIGEVLDGPVSANGYIWWNVDYGHGLYSGWSVEDGLQKVAAIPTLKWPLQGTLNERTVLLGFGANWVWGECPPGVVKKHVAIDVSATIGENVYAPEAGIVKAVVYDPNWHYCVTIEHSGFTTVCWHVDPLVGVGANVTKGQVIGTIADISPYDIHLHFGVRATTYSNTSNRGALPQSNCGGDPGFPEYFVNPTTLEYETSQPAAPPTHISPADGSTVSTLTPTFIWSSVPDADGYGLYVSEPPYGEDHLVFDSDAYYGGPISGTSLELPAGILSYGVTYHWNMNSYNSAGWGSCSSVWSFTTVSDAPPSVDAFNVSPSSVTLGSSFTISYTVSDDIGLQQTELWRANDVGGAPDWEGTDNPITTTPLSGQTSYSSSFTDAPPSVGTYWYGMHVVDTLGQWSFEPDPPGPIQVAVTVGTPPAPPTHISPPDGSTVSTLTPTFTWSSVPDADGYGLYISEPPYGEEHLVFDSDAYYGGPISGTSLELPPGILDYWVTYHWNMNSYNSAGWGSCSSAWSFTPTETTPRVEGIDVSSIQGYVDWSEVYNAGYRFAFARASWGDENPPTYIDEYFETNMENGHAAGMLMGAYHFAYPDYGTEAASEARHFLNVAGAYLKEGYLRPVLDLERGASIGKTALSNWVNEWMSTVKNETGIEPIIYTFSDYANNYLDSSINQYDLWIAHWTYNPDIPPNTGIWDDWDFWQYSDLGSVPGVSSNVDLDLFNGDMSALSDFVISVSSTGWKSPTAHKAGHVEGTYEWDNPTYAYTSNNQYATADDGIQLQGYYNFNFDIPAGVVIKGIEVRCEGKVDRLDICAEPRFALKISKDGSHFAPTTKSTDILTTSDTILTVGGSSGSVSDLWSMDWTPSDFGAEFTVEITPTCISTPTTTYHLDHIQVRVHYTIVEGDINGDGKVDFTDFAILGSQWLQAPGEPSADIAPHGGDNLVDFLDLAVLTDNWLEGS